MPAVDSSRCRVAGEGFTLLELLVAIAILLTLAAIAIPKVMRAERTAHGAAILVQLRVLSHELIVYRMDCGGYPESLDALNGPPGAGCPKGGAGSPDPTVAAGYRLIYSGTNRDPNGVYGGYTLTADPLNAGTEGNQFYFMDQSGIVRVRSGASASASDPALAP